MDKDENATATAAVSGAYFATSTDAAAVCAADAGVIAANVTPSVAAAAAVAAATIILAIVLAICLTYRYKLNKFAIRTYDSREL